MDLSVAAQLQGEDASATAALHGKSHLRDEQSFPGQLIVPQGGGHPLYCLARTAATAPHQLRQVVQCVEALQGVSSDPRLIGLSCLQHLRMPSMSHIQQACWQSAEKQQQFQACNIRGMLMHSPQRPDAV